MKSFDRIIVAIFTVAIALPQMSNLASAKSLKDCGKQEIISDMKQCLADNVAVLANREKNEARRKATAKRIDKKCERRTDARESIKGSSAWVLEYMICKETEYRKL